VANIVRSACSVQPRIYKLTLAIIFVPQVAGLTQGYGAVGPLLALWVHGFRGVFRFMALS
jgi:hypothetical protein